MFDLMASFFAYLTIGLEGLAIIFALMTFIISSKRRFFGMVTLGTLVDAVLAHLLSSIMTNPFKWSEQSPFNLQMNWTSQVGIIFILLPCVSLRISIWWIIMNRIDSWSTASTVIWACYIIHFLISGTIGLAIFIHSIALALLFIWIYLLLIWNFIMRFLINQVKVVRYGTSPLNITTVEFPSANNLTKMIQ
jgi:hypothetical protein